jgi:hypothetical protein
MNCQHLRTIGDNYGVTCQDCGEILAGFGFGGWFGERLQPEQACVHRFYVHDGIGICVFCETIERTTNEDTI